MKRKIISMVLAIIMVCGLFQMTALAGPNANNPTRVAENQKITITVPNEQGADNYYTLAMPYDGVMKIDYVGSNFRDGSDCYFVGRTEPELTGLSMGDSNGTFEGTHELSLSKGEHVIFIRVLAQYYTDGTSLTFSYTTIPSENQSAPPPSGGNLGGYQGEQVENIGVKLQWTPIQGSVGYRVYRSERQGELGIPATDFYTQFHEFIDVNVKPSTTYYYTVRQILREATVQGDPEQFGAESQQVQVRTPSRIIGDSLTPPSQGAQKKVIVMKIDDPMMTMANGTRQEIDPGRGTVPLIQNNRTLVPIRAIVEGMGGTVGWNASNREISLRYGNQNVMMWLGNTNITANGASKTMDVAPASINDRTMVPIRFAAENLGCAVEFINSTRQVVIVYY
jgi:hypothetical protein